MNTNFKFTNHAANERNQQRGINSTIYTLLPYADEVAAAGHARCLYFSQNSYRRMRAAGVSKKDICMIENKKALRIIVRDGVVITAMYANQNKKRVRRHER